MTRYRQAHDWGRHANRDQSPVEYSDEDLKDAEALLQKLNRQFLLRSIESIEAAAGEIRERFYAVVNHPDTGDMPEVFIDLKAALQEADDYLR